MGKGYDLENQLKWHFKNQGIFAFRLWTKQQQGELRKVDVIIFTENTGLYLLKLRMLKVKRKNILTPLLERVYWH